mgnify:CR=1 FL=1
MGIHTQFVQGPMVIRIVPEGLGIEAPGLINPLALPGLVGFSNQLTGLPQPVDADPGQSPAIGRKQAIRMGIRTGQGKAEILKGGTSLLFWDWSRIRAGSVLWR